MQYVSSTSKVQTMVLVIGAVIAGGCASTQPCPTPTNVPVIPADAKAVEFVKIMMANGKAGIDPDFL